PATVAADIAAHQRGPARPEADPHCPGPHGATRRTRTPLVTSRPHRPRSSPLMPLIVSRGPCGAGVLRGNLIVAIPSRRYHRHMAISYDPCVTSAIAAGVSPAAALFRSLADETRLRIVARLAAGEARVVDLTGELGLAQSTVSKHLACLRGCGLVDYRTQGRRAFHALARPERLAQR